MKYREKKEEIRNRLLEQLDYSVELTDEQVGELIDEAILQDGDIKLWNLKDRYQLRQEIFYAIRRLDILQSYLEDNSITEIMINGTEGFFVERAGKLSKLEETVFTEEQLSDIIQRIVAKCNRSVNEASPIVDARLENGARVHVVLKPIAINGPIVTIRRFPDHPITMEQLLEWDCITKEAVRFLKTLVEAGYNILISGGTGSGKTTFLNALSGYIPKNQRIITIEDSAELQLQGIKNLVRMETRNANVEGCHAIGIRDLIKASLRMRPTRIIVGEVRAAEAIDMIQCMNTGHDGSMSTAHANSAEDMLLRLATMIMMGDMDIPLAAIKQQIASGLDVIVHLGRLRDGSRRVIEITEVTGFEEDGILLNSIYLFEEDVEKTTGELVVGNLIRKGELNHVEKLKAAGLTVSYG